MQFFSQASQDRFVYTMLYKLLNKADDGYFVEIGAGHPISINNTFFLESNFNWKGISIDISMQHINLWSQCRKNPLVVTDALQCDYESLFNLFPKNIDYLSLDIDEHYDTVLKKLPLDKYMFKVITIEHDAYKYGDRFRNKEREILSSFGYKLLCADVVLETTSFEDWWIHPSFFPNDVLDRLDLLDLKYKDHTQLVNDISAL